jgi:formate-dependent nitrite reductase membrane component NrfD
LASGFYLVASLLVLFGFLSPSHSIWLWTTPVVSGVFLAITGGLLIWDLEHPERFYLIFTKSQWRSWLVKGAYVIAGYTLVLAVHFIASWFGSVRLQQWFMIAGIPLSVMSAVYTAYLFAQAKARDMWQNPLLPPHLFVQAILLGSAALLVFAVWSSGTSVDRFLGTANSLVLACVWLLAISSLLHLLMIWGEVSLTHPTAHARLAIWEMMWGRYRSDFWLGSALSILGAAVPWLAILGYINSPSAIAGVPLALIGLMLYENAYVQAGQSVPLA